jgi:hypothetical protein
LTPLDALIRCAGDAEGVGEAFAQDVRADNYVAQTLVEAAGTSVGDVHV